MIDSNDMTSHLPLRVHLTDVMSDGDERGAHDFGSTLNQFLCLPALDLLKAIAQNGDEEIDEDDGAEEEEGTEQERAPRTDKTCLFHRAEFLLSVNRQ